MYTIVFTDDAKKDLKELQRKAPQAIAKLAKLLDELKEHPRTGTGQVEPQRAMMGPCILDVSQKSIVLSIRSTMKW